MVTDYYEKSGLTPYLDKLGFNLVGYGCTTCIGNSGPLIPEVSQAVTDNDLTVCSVLSGNRNFEGRIHPECKMNFLASPLLVVAYALAGTLHIDLLRDPLGTGSDGQPVYLRDIWPTTDEITEVIDSCRARRDVQQGLRRRVCRRRPLALATGSRHRHLPVGSGVRRYVRKPPYFDGMGRDPQPVSRHHRCTSAGQAR